MGGGKRVWILRKGLCEGTQTCQKGVYVCVFAQLCQYKEKRKNKNQCLEMSVNNL